MTYGRYILLVVGTAMALGVLVGALGRLVDWVLS